eukprot:TRINITY_DN10010_c0_g1_i1.p1 TRINITY_DN10010_c0_g1~~TRINITY_DN10010_c0_g1_i1.p1  ORF type:complete len:193 (-),score=82.08 TRINITY_DN10010_c0_g1_i1:51-629(-)
MSAFKLTERFQLAIELINNTENEMFAPLLAKIISHLRTGEPVENGEKKEAEGEAEQAIVREACTYILEQAAYFSFPPQVLAEQLKQLHMDEDKSTAIASAWKAGAAPVIARLRGSTAVAPHLLQSVDWQLHMQIAQGSLSRVVQPSAIFKFGFSDDEAIPKTSEMVLEFSPDELRQFYMNLEKIQAQLDALS